MLGLVSLSLVYGLNRPFNVQRSAHAPSHCSNVFAWILGCTDNAVHHWNQIDVSQDSADLSLGTQSGRVYRSVSQTSNPGCTRFVSVVLMCIALGRRSVVPAPGT